MFNNVLHRNRAESDSVASERAADGSVVEERDADGRLVAERVDEPTTTRRPLFGQRRATDRTLVERPAAPVTEPVTEPTTEEVVEERPRWAHNSFSAVVGLVVGVVALGLTFTGLLAPLGVAVGVIGALISLTGLVRASRRGVTGHGAAFAGVIASLAAVILGVLAIQGELSWLNSNTDEVARLHNWLNANFTWLKRW